MKRRGTVLAALALTGCEAHFGRPHVLWALWALPLLLLFFGISERQRRRDMGRLLSARLWRDARPGQRRRRAALLTLAVAAATLALAQPRWGFTWEETRREGVDLVVLLDVSDSMLVQDVESGGRLTRLARAKREIHDLLRILNGDRIALVPFAGAAILSCPLTLDYDAAALFLDDIDTDSIAVKGTALGEAIRIGLTALNTTGGASQAILLITDGEDHGGDAQSAAEAARARGVRLFAVGIGRDEGAPIPLPGGGFHHDERGNLVLSRLDENTLQKIASTTGGRYVRSQAGSMDLEALYRGAISATLTPQQSGGKRRQHWHERFQWVLAVAVLALAVEGVLPERQP